MTYFFFTEAFFSLGFFDIGFFLGITFFFFALVLLLVLTIALYSSRVSTSWYAFMYSFLDFHCALVVFLVCAEMTRYATVNAIDIIMTVVSGIIATNVGTSLLEPIALSKTNATCAIKTIITIVIEMNAAIPYPFCFSTSTLPVFLFHHAAPIKVP